MIFVKIARIDMIPHEEFRNLPIGSTFKLYNEIRYETRRFNTRGHANFRIMVIRKFEFMMDKSKGPNFIL